MTYRNPQRYRNPQTTRTPTKTWMGPPEDVTGSAVQPTKDIKVDPKYLPQKRGDHYVDKHGRWTDEFGRPVIMPRSPGTHMGPPDEVTGYAIKGGKRWVLPMSKGSLGKIMKINPSMFASAVAPPNDIAAQRATRRTDLINALRRAMGYQ